MERKVFTVPQANLVLPRLSQLLGKLQERHKWLQANRQAVPYLIESRQIVNEGPVRPDYVHALLGFRATLREVEKIGAQVKDISTGLVDFPSRLYGRDVLLCWRMGEDRVAYWHDPEAGFAGRQPLPPVEGDSDGDKEGN
ncbi:MAG TPA: DUF2203 domain-containing protein [Candidatus Polarisedimenticolia bacterium]|nr:DUF2203 domain-containing protein [Candidatus Polarisedimenticolia bacterium]